MRDVLNRRVKKREAFRPFAPAVLRAYAADHFDLQSDAPFMNETCRVISPLSLPAVTHVDGSARPQTVDKDTAPRFAALLEAFYARTGCPILLNTSFNMRGQPIVCTPVDALFCFVQAGLDALVLENIVLTRADLPGNLPTLLASWERTPQFAFGEYRSAISETLYTFV
jgi:carbamoyltransferase